MAVENVYGKAREYDTDLDIFGVVFSFTVTDIVPIGFRQEALGYYVDVSPNEVFIPGGTNGFIGGG